MCGVSITECDVSRWFTFLGTYNEDIGVPFQITFIPTPLSESFQEEQVSNTTIIGISPPTTRVFLCSEAAHPSGSPCSCQDCPQSCVAESPFPVIAQVSNLDHVMLALPAALSTWNEWWFLMLRSGIGFLHGTISVRFTCIPFICNLEFMLLDFRKNVRSHPSTACWFYHFLHSVDSVSPCSSSP